MDARSFLKRNLPPQVRSWVHQLRDAVAAPPIDDVMLADYRLLRDDATRARLTLVLPMLQKGADFGGTATGIDIFARLGLALQEMSATDLRVIITDVLADTDPSIVVTRAAKAGLAIATEQIEFVTDRRASIGVRGHEVFMTYNWWTTLNFSKLRDEQAKVFAHDPRPLVWLMQDYEPAFMGFSSGHLLARGAYDGCAPLWGVINSSCLADYIDMMGHKPERRFVFEPVIAEALRPYLSRVEGSVRCKKMLVYGRPNVERNCFPALVRGLRHWACCYPEFADWEIVSAGVEHPAIDLGDGRKLASVGKLSLDDYAHVLLESSVGVSLMASPHPSYPPLEMAHFGLQTVTNSYLCKDLSAFHPNIISTPVISEEALAKAMAEACTRSEQSHRPHTNPDYTRTEAYPFLDDLAAAIGDAVRRV